MLHVWFSAAPRTDGLKNREPTTTAHFQFRMCRPPPRLSPQSFTPIQSAGQGPWLGLFYLLLLQHQIPRERVGLDHAFALPVRGFEPAPRVAVLALWRVLDGEVQLVAQLAALGGAAELERAARVDRQVQVAGDGLRAHAAVAPACARPVEVARRRLELELRRRARRAHHAVARDGVEAHRAARLLDARVPGDGVHRALPPLPHLAAPRRATASHSPR